MLSIYIYPTNLSVRDYQLAIVKKALFENVLCALPTGLGKTFIASTVMLNYYRWTRTAKVVFMAPTRPLVSQQLEACLGITGIPREDTSILIGGTFTPALRAQEWAEKRVFFATPQTVDNDLKRGILDPKSVACLVVDEAHRATGNHAYAEVVRFLNRFNQSYRILALTATPSTTLEGVQAIITNLNISRVELRTEDSDDIKPYVHKKHIERLVSEFSDDQWSVLTPLAAALQPLVDEVYNAKVLFISDAALLNQFAAVNAMKTLMAQNHGPPNGAQFKYLAILKVLASMGHAINLLKFHGITPFYNYMEGFEQEARYGLTAAGNKKKSAGKYTSMFLNSNDYVTCMARCKELIYQPGGVLLNRKFVGHPKLENLIEVTRAFFRDAAPDSKAIIFSAYRDSGTEILRVLKENVPQCRPHLFIGQSAGRASTTDREVQTNASTGKAKASGLGMTQKEQQTVVAQFKAQTFNTLVATSIGEEGLDIGEVDLIICYDASSSPIRMLQRIGRTGRKRAGRIYMLLSEREERKLDQSFDNYKYIQTLIAGSLGGDGGGGGEQLEYAPRHRILPAGAVPECVQMVVDIPESNRELLAHEDIVKEVELTQRQSRQKQGARKKTKAPKKKFNMPDNVETGFMSAAAALGQTTIDAAAKKGRKKNEKPEVVDFTKDIDEDDDEDGNGEDDDDESWMWDDAPKSNPRKTGVTASKSLSAAPKTKAKSKDTSKSKPKTSKATPDKNRDKDKVLYYDASRDGPDYGLLPPSPPSLPRTSTSSSGSSGMPGKRVPGEDEAEEGRPTPAPPSKRSSKRFSALMAVLSSTSEEDVAALQRNLRLEDVEGESTQAQAAAAPAVEEQGQGARRGPEPSLKRKKGGPRRLVLSDDEDEDEGWDGEKYGAAGEGAEGEGKAGLSGEAGPKKRRRL